MTKQELIDNHGTLEDFSRACNLAADSLEITTEECERAIAGYRQKLAEVSAE